mgnify:CR=1 FL=1|jgi:hypothetical protein
MKKYRTKKACLDCGKSFYGSADKLYCDECAKKRKSNVIRIRACRMCSKEFLGGPRAFYCPDCRKIRTKEAQKRFRQGKTAKRKLGSVDKCELCGNEYIVTAGRQKYCSEKCQHEAGLLLQKEYKSAYNKETEQTKKKLEKNSKKQKICEYCGKKFQSKIANNTCSDYCRHKQAQIRNARARINRGEKVNLDTLLKERDEYRNKGGTWMNVKNQHGKEVNFDEALKLMDEDLREKVAYELSLSSDQEFFNKYAEAHKKKFGDTWGPDQEKI